MALLNASNAPVAMTPHTFQIDLPTEEAVKITAIDWFALIPAVLAAINAFRTGDAAAFIQALQAIIKAVTG